MRLRLTVVLALVLGACAFLLVKVLDDSVTYFRNTDEAVAAHDDLGTKRFRLQGTVVPDSVTQAGGLVEFDVEFHCETVHVRHEGDPPELFKPGIPVVLEGSFADGVDARGHYIYDSDRILVKHTSEYRTDRLEKAGEEVKVCNA